MNSFTEKKKGSFYGAILFSLIFLFNPNVSVIDILPDFVAYFVLARLFLYPSDCAPHFEEARLAFKRLGWLNFFKFFGFLVMILVKRENSSENDIIPLVTLVFAVLEVLLMVMAVKKTFDALFYLGNRSDALSTIRPFFIGKIKIRPEDARTLSYFFAVFKCLVYFLPTPFLLTNTSLTPSGRLTLAKGFIIVLLVSNLLGILVGIFWLITMRKYALSIKKEGKFFSTLDKLLKENFEFDINKKIKLRSISFALSVFSVASFFTLELSLVESYDVNLIPHFIYAALLLFAVYRLAQFTKGAKYAYICGGVYCLVSTVTYFVQSHFLTEYGYARLITSSKARAFYPVITALSIVEFASLIAFLFFIWRMLRSFIFAHTGIKEDSVSETGDSYFGSLLKKNLIFFTVGALAGLIKLISVIVHGSVKLVYANTEGELQAAVVSPAVEWIGLVVAIFAFVYIGITLYFISTLKDEVKMKYEEA